MGKISVVSDLTQVNDATTFIRFASQLLDIMTSTINGNLEFDQNLKTQSVTVVFNAINSDVAVPHLLNKTSVKYFVTSKSAACDVFTGITGQSSTTMYLQSTAGSSTNPITITLELF